MLSEDCRREARTAIADLVGLVAQSRRAPSVSTLDAIVDALVPILSIRPPKPLPVALGAPVELSVAEAALMAQVVAARIAHPSHTPVRAVRAGLDAVNESRVKAATREAHVTNVAPVSDVVRVWRLGVEHRGFVWVDVDGDRWRWRAGSGWQYARSADAPGDVAGECDWVPLPEGSFAPSSRYAPFTREQVR